MSSIIKYSGEDVRAALFWIMWGIPHNNKLVEQYRLDESLSYSSILQFFNFLEIMEKISDYYSVRRLLTENIEVNFSDWLKAINMLTGSRLKYEVNTILIPKINTVFDAVQSSPLSSLPCEFGRISVFENIFNENFSIKNYAFELTVNKIFLFLFVFPI